MEASAAKRIQSLGLARPRGWVLYGIVAALLLFVQAPLVLAGGMTGEPRSRTPLRDQNVVQVPKDKSRIIDLPYPVARVSVANPGIADILVVSPRQIYIVGKQFGTTNMTLWDDNDRVKNMLGLEVTHDLQTLKQKMFRFLPGESIGIESSQGAIVLSGEVSSTDKLDAALRLAETHAAGEANVLNLLQVGGAQQVLLEVKIAEIARSFLKRLDVRFTGLFNDGTTRLGLLSRSGVDTPDGIALDQTFTDRAAFANYTGGNWFFNVIIDAAEDKGLAKILAEPNLTTLSGQEATFLAGGEFPVPVNSGNEGTQVSFKQFGVGVAFVPMVLDSGLVSLSVDVSVSELTFENSVGIATGSTSVLAVPGLSKRSASSTVEVPSGQTIAIAGLINERLRENVNKFPRLGDVPVLGTLFRSPEYQKNETELVIFVTPRLARPIEPDMVKLPTDDFVEPNDVEFYLMGRLQGRKPGDRPASSGNRLGPDNKGSEGPFGHDL
jgi:pilus assembly protein CpaC